MNFRRSVPTLIVATVLVVLAAGATAFALNEAHRTRVLTTDSIVYVDTSRHIAAGDGVRTSILSVDDSALNPAQTQYPPLYSITMAPFIAFGVNPVQAGRFVSAIAFGLLVLVIGAWLWKSAGAIIGIAGAAVLPTLPALTGTAASVWADSLFALIVAAMTIVGIKALRSPGKFRWFLCGSIVGIAILTKYLGIILVGVVVAFLAIEFFKRKDAIQTLRHTGFALAGMAWFVLPLLSRNVLLNKPVGGAERFYSTQSISAVLSDTWSTLSADFTEHWLWIALLTLVGITLVLAALHRPARDELKKINQRYLVPLLSVIAMYLLGLIVTRWFIDTDPVHTRFTMAVYPLIVVVIVLLIATAARSMSRMAMAATLLLIAALSIGWTIKAYDFGIGPYAIQETSRAQWISQHTTNGDLLIGDHAAEYNLYLDRTVVRLSGDANHSETTVNTLNALVEKWKPQFQHLYLTLTPNLDPNDYGELMSRLSRGDASAASVRLVHEQDKLLVYELD